MQSRRTFLPISLLTLVAVAVGVVTVGAPARAQQDGPTAAEVAAWVETFYNQTSSTTARFTQRYRNRVHQHTQISHGRLRLRRPGMIRFDYDDPNGKVVVSDGETLVVYEPPSDGATRGQYFQQPIADAQLPAALGFLTGEGSFTRDYRFRLLDASRLENRQILELRPRRPNPHYTRIILFIDSSEAARGTVHRLVIVDHSNNQNRFDLQQQNNRQAVAESTFRWRPPANARRIQP